MAVIDSRYLVRLGFVLAIAAAHTGLLEAQSPKPGPQPLEVGGIAVSGLLRVRAESWDWFGNSPAGRYVYPASLFRLGLRRSKPSREWQVEFAVPVVLGLPDQPLGAGPQGLGASYFVANDRRRNATMLFVKQALVNFKDLAGVDGQTLRLGRMEFFDGVEGSPRNTTVAAVKRDRVSSRLLANFGFTHVQRSFDGVQYALDRGPLNVTFFAARPTRGVFQVNGWGELDITALYGALTREVGDSANAGEWRLFGLGYNDYRNAAVKIDNRPLARRQADSAHVNLGTVGGHYLRAIETSHGTFDLLAWGAIQAGSWGDLRHRAGALAIESGWQSSSRLSPWIRGGFDYGSGDGNSNDAIHGTFFQLLPTPRLYARFPFFNMMNTADTFGELTLKPLRAATVRGDVHLLRLSAANDLWYQGGGAFQPATFGYVGQPSSGQSGLATLSDVSADVAITPTLSMGLYYSYAAGGAVPRALYTADPSAAFGYVELALRF